MTETHVVEISNSRLEFWNTVRRIVAIVVPSITITGAALNFLASDFHSSISIHALFLFFK